MRRNTQADLLVLRRDAVQFNRAALRPVERRNIVFTVLALGLGLSQEALEPRNGAQGGLEPGPRRDEHREALAELHDVEHGEADGALRRRVGEAKGETDENDSDSRNYEVQDYVEPTLDAVPGMCQWLVDGTCDSGVQVQRQDLKRGLVESTPGVVPATYIM